MGKAISDLMAKALNGTCTFEKKNVILFISFILVPCLEHVSFQEIFSKWMRVHLSLVSQPSISESIDI